jgi:hypothetical protein
MYEFRHPNSLDPDPSSEANSCLAMKEILSILCQLKVHCRIHKTSVLVSILSLMNLSTTLHPVSLTHFNITAFMLRSP